MAAARAEIQHRAGGRVRLRLLDPPDQLETAIAEIRGPDTDWKTRINSKMRSVVIEARDDRQVEEALHTFQEKGILDLSTASSPSVAKVKQAPSEVVRNQVDQFVKTISDGRLDFRSGMAFLLLGLGAKQALSGNFLPAGLSLVFYGIEMLERPRGV